MNARLRSSLVAAAVAASLAAGAPARADGLRVSATAGAGFYGGQNYVQLGGRVGYDVLLGLTPEVQGVAWFGATPEIFKLAPGITWYAPIPGVSPYVGAYYAHWVAGSGYPDQDALGGRAGLGLFSAGPAGLSIGVAYERLMSCSRDCDVWSPEVMASFRF